MNGHSNWTVEQQEVWAVVEAFNRAFSQNDPDSYFTFIDEEIIVLTPTNPYRIEGIEDDREGFEYGLRQGSSRIGYFQELQPSVRVFGETAVVTYYSRSSSGPQGNEKTHYLKETDILVKRGGSWRVVHIHVSATL